MTNNIKAQIGFAVNAVLGAVVLFGVDLSKEQIGGVVLAVNAILALIQSLTYKDSPKRIPDEVA